MRRAGAPGLTLAAPSKWDGGVMPGVCLGASSDQARNVYVIGENGWFSEYLGRVFERSGKAQSWWDVAIIVCGEKLSVSDSVHNGGGDDSR